MSLLSQIIAYAQAVGADVKALTSGKVDKVTGYGLSSNDYTLIEKNRVATLSSIGLPAGPAYATTMNLGAIDSISMTMTTLAAAVSISSFGTAAAGVERRLLITATGGTKTIVYNATSMIIPGAANLVLTLGMVVELVSLGGGNWRITAVIRADGYPLLGFSDQNYNLTEKQKLAAMSTPGYFSQISLVSPVPMGVDMTYCTLASSSTTAVTIAAFAAVGTGPGSSRQCSVVSLGSGVVTLVNSTALALPGAANIIMAVGDTFTAWYIATNQWVVTDYKRNGVPLLGSSDTNYSAAEKTKLGAIAANATQNSTDAALLSRTNHTGTQAIATVDSLQSTLDSKIASSLIGVASGVASLDTGGKVPAAQLPSYVDDVLEYATYSAFPSTGESGKIYVCDTPYTSGGVTSSQFRWGGSAYAPIIASPGSTDAVTEGSTNLYFTVARVLAAVLDTLTLTNASIAVGDSARVMFGKLQAQVSAREPTVAVGTAAQYWNGLKAWTDFATTVRASVMTGVVFTTATAMLATDTLLSAMGKLQGQISAIPAMILASSRSFATAVYGVSAAFTVPTTGTGVCYQANAPALTLTLQAGVVPNATYSFRHNSTGVLTLATVTGKTIAGGPGTPAQSLVLQSGDWVELIAQDATGNFFVTGRGSNFDFPTLFATIRRSWNGGFTRLSASATLTVAQVGQVIWSIAAGLTFTLPTPSSVVTAGQGFTLRNGSNGTLTITTPAGSIYSDLESTSATSVILGPREWVEISTDQANWAINARGSLAKGQNVVNPIDRVVTNAAATGTVTLDCSLGSIFDLTLTGNTTLAFSNVPPLAGENFAVVVKVRQGTTAYTLTPPASSTPITSGSAVPSTPGASKRSDYVFSTTTGSAWDWYGGAAT